MLLTCSDGVNVLLYYGVTVLLTCSDGVTVLLTCGDGVNVTHLR